MWEAAATPGDGNACLSGGEQGRSEGPGGGQRGSWGLPSPPAFNTPRALNTSCPSRDHDIH